MCRSSAGSFTIEIFSCSMDDRGRDARHTRASPFACSAAPLAVPFTMQLPEGLVMQGLEGECGDY